MVDEMLMGRYGVCARLSVVLSLIVVVLSPSTGPRPPWESSLLPPATAPGFPSSFFFPTPPTVTDTALVGELGALAAYSTLAPFVRRPSDASIARRPPGSFRLPSASIFLLLPIIFSTFCSDDKPRICLGTSAFAPVDGEGDGGGIVGEARKESSIELCPTLCVSDCWSSLISGSSSRLKCDSCGTGLIYGLVSALLPSAVLTVVTGEVGPETDTVGELCATLVLALGRGGGGRLWRPPAPIDPAWCGDPGRGVRMRSSYSSAARRLEEMTSECELEEADEPRAVARPSERRSRSVRSSGRSSVAVVPARDMVRASSKVGRESRQGGGGSCEETILELEDRGRGRPRTESDSDIGQTSQRLHGGGTPRAPIEVCINV